MKRIFIAGEGPNDLGGWCRLRQYRDDPPLPGALETLLRKVCNEGWLILDSIRWKDIKKLRSRYRKTAGHQVRINAGANEEKNVHAAALMARERGCQVLAFFRDRDGNQNLQRQEDIESGIERAKQDSEGLEVIGGMATERLESWLVALSGGNGSESLGRTRVAEILQQLGVHEKKTDSYVELIESADLDSLPEDAYSLRSWLEQAREILRDAE